MHKNKINTNNEEYKIRKGTYWYEKYTLEKFIERLLKDMYEADKRGTYKMQIQAHLREEFQKEENDKRFKKTTGGGIPSLNLKNAVSAGGAFGSIMSPSGNDINYTTWWIFWCRMIKTFI